MNKEQWTVAGLLLVLLGLEVLKNPTLKSWFMSGWVGFNKAFQPGQSNTATIPGSQVPVIPGQTIPGKTPGIL
jgi:hypothetical protein